MIGVTVQGKTDKQPVTLLLYPDTDNPELCPITNLLIYIYMLEMEGGKLVPTLDEINNPPADRVYTTYLEYQQYQKRFQKECETLFQRKGPFGTHTLRKTGYLMSIWAGASFSDAMKSARHLDVKSAQLYERDCKALKELQTQEMKMKLLKPLKLLELTCHQQKETKIEQRK